MALIARLRHMDYCAEYGFEYQGVCSRMVMTPQTGVWVWLMMWIQYEVKVYWLEGFWVHGIRKPLDIGLNMILSWHVAHVVAFSLANCMGACFFPPMQGRAGVARRFHSDFVVPKVWPMWISLFLVSWNIRDTIYKNHILQHSPIMWKMFQL